ncbi:MULTISPECIES: DUF2711 family protein [Bacillus cereus group]|uniref:DUF2711 family protein n=1 Tax=Bacillus cereus group TaxID=86661 RepID=UPI000943CBE7|nr:MULTISPECIES: DUF2711 family protein [Bacillus cereus group]MCU5224616.1 DUF2711 domain-containing protein [Bacillus tropicus]
MQRFIFDTINTKKHNAGIRIFQSLRGGYILLDYILLDDKSPIFDTNGLLEVDNTTPLDIWDISNNELIITSEDNEYAFMSIFDSFTTLLLAKEENIEYIVQSMNVEAVICDKKTMIDWYF